MVTISECLCYMVVLSSVLEEGKYQIPETHIILTVLLCTVFIYISFSFVIFYFFVIYEKKLFCVSNKRAFKL